MQDNILLERLPVVCTRGMILFPDQDLIFDVGREKSINAIKDAEENFDGRVFLVSQQDLLVEYPLKDDLYEVGVIAEIKNIRKQDGFYRVKFRGQDRAVIREFMDADDAYYGLIERLSDIVGDPKEELVLVRKVMKRFEELQAHDTSLSKENLQMITAGIAAGQVADQFASILPMAFERRQELLETLDINERLLMIITEMENEKQLEVIESRIDEKVKDRIEENQKEYYLREKLRAIKEELGDIPDQNQDIEALREKVKNNPYPENIKNRALEEIQRYELLPNASSESGVVKTYLDWLINLPWWEESKDQEDLEAAKNILDDEHFGLEKVKQRILEYLAVKQMSKTLNAPIICLVGPPGVGKTSLAKSVAHALERKFVKISLGGVKDESEIRGHRRTYLGSLPGRFIQSMKKAGTINPVFLIDEIDKMASDYKGDPASAMLEVLDPEQNSMFSDHYLEEPYDLSKVLFIATANYIQDIPEALRDRLEIIELTSYTELEKVQIANKHLVSKQIKVNGLKNSQFKIDEDMLLYLIRYYTRESGVRQLERTIATLARKTVLAILKDNKKKIVVNKKIINEWLGKEKVEYGKKEEENQVGTVTGLAYTSFGGDVLQIEVTHFPGKGKLVLTGQLGEVMSESATIAYDYVRANAAKYNIDDKMFENQDVHLHVPEGAVPKDGPSAGITLTTAIVSCLANIPVKANLAMTGEVTLRGNVLPIGGLKEKSMAAHRCGITTILIPAANEKDLDDVAEEIKKVVNFIPVKHVSEVLELALVR